MTTDLIKIDEVKNILSSFPDIIGKNTNSVKKCNEAGQALLDTIEGEGMNETIDQAAADYLKKVNVTLKNMDERRKPITQIFDKVRSFFTSQEKEIDPKDVSTIPGKLVTKRNDYAKFKYEEEQKEKKKPSKKLELIQRKQAISKRLRIISFLISTSIFHLRFPNYRISSQGLLMRILTEKLSVLPFFRLNIPKRISINS